MTSPHNDASKTQSPQLYLYTCLAANHLGEAAATVVSTLISFGRLTAKELGQRSKLTQKQTRSSLVSLIQLNCVQYWAEKLVLKDATVHYSFNSRGMDVLLHGGDIISHVKSVYGDESAEAMQNIAENGSIAVRDYIGSFESPQTRHEKMLIVVKLYTDGWLRRLQKFEFHPAEDLWHQMYTETLKLMPRLATTSEVKRVAEAKEQTKVKFTNFYASGNDTKDVFCVEEGFHKLRPEVTLAINLNRYEKAMRLRAFVLLATLRMGLITAQVYKACCSLIEQKSPDLHHRFFDVSGLVIDPDEGQMFLRTIENALVDSKLTVFTIRDVARVLSENLDLRNSILTQNFLKPGKRSLGSPTEQPLKKIKLENGAEMGDSLALEVLLEESSGVHIDDSILANTDLDMHLEALTAEHIRLLAFGNIPFVLETGPGSYTIPYMHISKYVKRFHYDALIKVTFGPNALRVLRYIKLMKLVDEKAISNTVLWKDKSVKNEVYKLVTNNVLEIQEVPRSADSAALKTFYLFRHKEIPCYDFLSRSLLYSMGEVLSNVNEFKAEHKIFLEKCEREDVKGHEEELLLDTELKTLRDLQVREVKNIGRFNRIKWLQFIFGTL